MFRIAFIISSPPSSPPLPDYYILIIIEWTISPEITLTVYVVENLKIQISEENILERTFTQQFLSQIPRREVIVFSLNYLVSCNLLQQRRLLTSSWAPHFLANNKRLGATNRPGNSRKCSENKGSLCKRKHYLLPFEIPPYKRCLKHLQPLFSDKILKKINIYEFFRQKLS